jgi:hypothetical protein
MKALKKMDVLLVIAVNATLSVWLQRNQTPKLEEIQPEARQKPDGPDETVGEQSAT